MKAWPPSRPIKPRNRFHCRRNATRQHLGGSLASMPASGDNGDRAVAHAVIKRIGGVKGDGSKAGVKGYTFSISPRRNGLVRHSGRWIIDCSEVSEESQCSNLPRNTAVRNPFHRNPLRFASGLIPGFSPKPTWTSRCMVVASGWHLLREASSRVALGPTESDVPRPMFSATTDRRTP